MFKYGNDPEWLNCFGTLSLCASGSIIIIIASDVYFFLFFVVKAAWYELNCRWILDTIIYSLFILLAFLNFLVDMNSHFSPNLDHNYYCKE